MNKKVLLILVALLLVGGVAVFMFVLPKSEPPIVYTNYSPGEFFVTNVNNSNRLLKTAVVLVLDTDKHQEMMDEENALIRDKIIFILRELDEDAIKDKATPDMLRTRIMETLNESLGIDNIVKVRFNDFVMQ